MVRAKFYVASVTKSGSPNAKVQTSSVELIAVYGGSEENKRFFASTPGGNIRLSVLNDEAAKFFEPGVEVYVDFTKVDNDESHD